MRYNSSIKFDYNQVVGNLDEFYTDTQSSAEPILKKGAKILETYAKKKVATSKKGKQGRYPHPPGTLRKSIKVGYVKRGRGKIGIKVGIERSI